MQRNRRSFLAVAGLAPLALGLAGRARGAEQAACYDPAALSLSQKRQRRGIGYVEPSADPAKHCGGCAFFTATSGASGCGTCQLLGGGPVNATAVCNSYAPKA